MRSYLLSFAFVLSLLCGYTAVVLTSHTPLKTEPNRASTNAGDTDHREPAAEASATPADI